MQRFVDFELDGIDTNDYPDFCDAFICSATVIEADGTTREATESELDELNEDSDLVHSLVWERLY